MTDLDLDGVIAYVPDPSLNLPALMIKRSKIGCKLHVPRGSCSYYDENIEAWKGIVDPEDEEPENEEPEDIISETENSMEGIGKWKTIKSNDSPDRYGSSSSTPLGKNRLPRDWYEFIQLWACCCSKFD